MAAYIGSACCDENGRATGGKAGDQKQKTTPDYAGEVKMEKFYVSSKGWYILRAKSVDVAMALAASMITACNNPNIGYNQNDRYGVVKSGTATKKKVNSDCSSLVRTCVKEATGKDPGDFTTANEVDILMKTTKFTKLTYVSGTTLYTGDILVTKTKGHTAIVTSGAARTTAIKYYPVYQGNTTSIVDALHAVGEKDASLTNRKKIAVANNIKDYKGTTTQNTKMLNLLKQGKLKKA